MSRNDLFVLLAGAIVVTVLTGGPPPLPRSSSVTISSLISAPAEGGFGDPALFQRSFEHQ